MSATLRLSLTDAAGNDLNGHVSVDLFATTSSERLQVAQVVGRELVVTGVAANPVMDYRVVVSPANHRTVQFFLRFTDGQEISFSATVPVEPSKVVSIIGPTFQQLPVAAQTVLNEARCPSFVRSDGSFVTGNQLYGLLDERPLLKAALLNIFAKAAATPLIGGTNCLNRFGALLRVAQDRAYFSATSALLEETAQSALFHPVSAALHAPLPEYHLVSSFKTFDRYGNLQLTFQRLRDSGDDYAVDVDIDDAQGIEHLFQVLRNSVLGPTNPYDIHDILLRQTPAVDPGYRFAFASAAASTG